MTLGERSLAPYITEKGRDLRVDLLRGYFVLAMVVDHVCGASPLWLLTGGNRFFTGAAEGFVLTSGLVAGLVYARLIKRDGMARSLMKMLTRAFKLYLLTLALTLALLPLSELLGLPWAQGVDMSDPFSLIVSIVTLHRTCYLVDVMLLYTVLFLLAPLALVLMEQGKRWWVLGISWLLWGVFQLWPQHAMLPWPIAGNYLFNFSAWQVIFFSGLVLGYGRSAMPQPRPRTARILLALTGAGLLGLIALWVVARGPGAVSPTTSYDLRTFVEDMFLDKVAVRPGRLLASCVTFSFLFLATTVFWQQVRRVVGWLLLPLGQNALYAYTAHVVLVALAALLPLNLHNGSPAWLNALVQAASVGLIWLGVRYQVLAPTPRTQRAYNLSPVLFAALAGVVCYLMPAAVGPAPTAAAVAEAVNRFGTPLPAKEATPTQRVNRFGTPLPVEGARATPTPASRPAGLLDKLLPHLAATPTPTPEPDPMERVAEWVGEINGTLEERWFYSAALGRQMPYWTYLPPGYGTDGQRYPVLYLLHGASGHRDEWIAFGVVEMADREMAAGALTPMIIIMPQGDTQFWVDSVDGPPWGRYVTQDLVAEVDSTLSTLAARPARALGGLSMGGFGALSLGFTNPEIFGVIGAHAPSLHVASSDVPFLGDGEEYARRDPVNLAGTATGLEGLQIWIDTAEQDNWRSRAQEMHEILDGRGVEHFWQVFPGEHVGDYWISHMGEYLEFYSRTLAVQ